MCYCKLNIHGSIVNESHLSNSGTTAKTKKNKKKRNSVLPELLHPGSPDFSLPRSKAAFSDHILCTSSHMVFAVLLERGHQGRLSMSFMDICPSPSSEAVVCMVFSDWQLDFNISSNLISQPILINPCSVSVITYGAHRRVWFWKCNSPPPSHCLYLISCFFFLYLG